MALSVFDILRQVREADSDLGGIVTTASFVETATIDFQHLNLQNFKGEDTLRIGGLQIEANFQGFCPKDTDLIEQDIITNDSGVTRYQVMFVQDRWQDHIEFFAKKIKGVND